MQTVTVPMESLAEVIRLQLDNGGRANLTVTGNSMYPMLLGRRDSVTLIPPANLKKGDVILFQRESGAYILHRIIGITAQGYICSGDNQAIREPVSPERVVAVVDSFVRKGKCHTVKTGFYRFYSAVWVGMFGLRPVYLVCWRYLGRLRRKLRSVFRNK
ncbi:MAG: hypothetical protein IJX37_10395 [Oscillospiraceae bacterium]|nr:hypothetical protein [Oscillospiraceae bacterium]